MKSNKTMMLAVLGLLTAIVFVLQNYAIAIRFGTFAISLVLAPIVIGAALYGWKAGAWLGTVFGVVVLFTDAGPFLAISVPGTIITCILKGMLAGACAGLVYRALCKKNELLAIFSAAVVAPVVNTGIFVAGTYLFFLDTVSEWGAGAGYDNVHLYILCGFIGMNFIVELIVNLFLATAIERIIGVVKKNKSLSA